ncbi:hypothetical protein [Kitasatospora sp. NPDC101183]|uniref:hypothetical protein n=1 Tax=Kitasatospora sp. NPDC101183 TaxID=3364100 RepID=UPI0038224744
MDNYISHSAHRRDTWRAHPSIKGVRRAIEWDQGRNHLTIFGLEHTPAGRVYVEIPREAWDTEFSD